MLEYPHHVPLHAHLVGPMTAAGANSERHLSAELNKFLLESPIAVYISFGTQLLLDRMSLRKVCSSSSSSTYQWLTGCG